MTCLLLQCTNIKDVSFIVDFSPLFFVFFWIDRCIFEIFLCREQQIFVSTKIKKHMVSSNLNSLDRVVRISKVEASFSFPTNFANVCEQTFSPASTYVRHPFWNHDCQPTFSKKKI